MNIWALNKHESIKHLLLLLQQDYGPDALKIDIDDDSHEQSVRFTDAEDQKIGLYVYTYGQNEYRYGVHIEYPDNVDTAIVNTLDILENVTYETLVEMLEFYYDLRPHNVAFATRG